MHIDKRLSAASALEHAWLRKHVEQPQLELDRGILENLRSFRGQKRLGSLILLYMVANLSNTSVAGLRDIFRAIDKDNSGQITPEELKEAIETAGEEGEAAMHDILKNVDLNENGKIEYSEFLAAAVDRTTLVTPANVQFAFRHIDVDSSGVVTRTKLKNALAREGKKYKEEEVDEMIEEAGLEGDSLTLEEFYKLCKTYL